VWPLCGGSNFTGDENWRVVSSSFLIAFKKKNLLNNCCCIPPNLKQIFFSNFCFHCNHIAMVHIYPAAAIAGAEFDDPIDTNHQCESLSFLILAIFLLPCIVVNIVVCVRVGRLFKVLQVVIIYMLYLY